MQLDIEFYKLFTQTKMEIVKVKKMLDAVMGKFTEGQASFEQSKLLKDHDRMHNM